MQLMQTIWKGWIGLALLPALMLTLTGCAPKVVAAPPSPSVKPILPDSLRQCPQPLSWLPNLTCSAQPSGNPLA